MEGLIAVQNKCESAAKDNEKEQFWGQGEEGWE